MVLGGSDDWHKRAKARTNPKYARNYRRRRVLLRGVLLLVVLGVLLWAALTVGM